MVVPVGQQNPKRVPMGCVYLGRYSLRGFLIGIAVGIVNARQNHRAAVSLQDNGLIGKHHDALCGQDFLQLRHVPHGPFVIPGDIIGWRNVRKTPRSLGGVIRRNFGEGVQKIAHQENILRLRFPDGFQKVLVVRAEVCRMKVPQDHSAAAVKTLGQSGEGRFKLGGL